MGTTSETRMGRPRGFDDEAAIDAAMRVFWEKSYEGATMADLTEAMGINRSSMYAAFGDKEALFRRAVERYRREQMAFVRAALGLPKLRDAVAALLRDSAEFFGTPGNPKGCLSVTGAIACGTNSQAARDVMIEWQRQSQTAVRKRVAQAQREGDLPQSINSVDFADYISALLSGLAVQATNGATKAEMKRSMEFALKLLPI